MNLWQRLAHRWFGWDYIAFEFGFCHFIERVRTLPNGDVCIYFISGIYHLRQDGTMISPDGGEHKYKPLTWRLQGQTSPSLRVVK